MATDKVTVTCSQCGKQYPVPRSRLGQKGRCPCGNVVLVEEPTAVERSPAASSPTPSPAQKPATRPRKRDPMVNIPERPCVTCGRIVKETQMICPKCKKSTDGRLPDHFDTLRAELADDPELDPYSRAQDWQNRLDLPADSWDYILELALTESARMATAEEVALCKREYKATDKVASKVGFGLPPFHRGCACDVITLEDKNGVTHLVPMTPADACPYCHAIANEIFDLIEV